LPQAPTYPSGRPFIGATQNIHQHVPGAVSCQKLNHITEAVSRMQWRKMMLTALKKKMVQLQTNPNLQEVILHCIDNTLAARNINTHGPFQAAKGTSKNWLGRHALPILVD
jgi:hypothetical protein